MARPNALSRPLSMARGPSSSLERGPDASRDPRYAVPYVLGEPDAPPVRRVRVQRDASELAPQVARGFPYSMAPASAPPFPQASPRQADRSYDSWSSPHFAGPPSTAGPGGYVDSPSVRGARPSDWEESDMSSRSSTSSPALVAPRHQNTRDRNETTPQLVTPMRQRTAKFRSNSAKTEQRRLSRQCTIEGCDNYTIDRGLCFRHGGGKVCMIEGCTSSAKARGVCWRHGGSVLCTVEGCNRGAKSRGLCWSHGGGTKCSVDGCVKTTVSKGLCWTHGGGKRCLFDGCKRPASEKTHNFCPTHRAQVSQKGFVFEV